MSFLAQINTNIERHQFNYYGIMSVTIMAGTCLASVALMFMLMNNAPVWQLTVLAGTAMGSNAAAISHSPLKWVVWMFGLNVIVSLVLLFAHLF